MAEVAAVPALTGITPVAARLKRLGILGQLLSMAILALVFGVGTGGRYLSLDNLHAIVGLAGIPALLCLGLHQVIIIGGMDMSLEGSWPSAAWRWGCCSRTATTPWTSAS